MSTQSPLSRLRRWTLWAETSPPSGGSFQSSGPKNGGTGGFPTECPTLSV